MSGPQTMKRNLIMLATFMTFHHESAGALIRSLLRPPASVRDMQLSSGFFLRRWNFVDDGAEPALTHAHTHTSACNWYQHPYPPIAPCQCLKEAVELLGTPSNEWRRKVQSKVLRMDGKEKFATLRVLKRKSLCTNTSRSGRSTQPHDHTTARSYTFLAQVTK